MRARGTVVAMLAGLLAAAPPATAQQPGPGENLGLGREFGAFLDAEKADAMIRDCEDQVARVKAGAAQWREVMEAYRAAQQAYERAQARLEASDQALIDAQRRASVATGPEAAALAQVLQTRGAENADLEYRRNGARDRFEAARASARVRAGELVAYFGSIGMSAGQLSGTPEDLIQRQAARCERMKLWAGQGSRVRQQMAEPAPISSWPDGAIDGWKGAWSCRWRSSAGGQALQANIDAHANAWLEEDGTVLVHFSTEWVRTWPPGRVTHIFSPLVVRQSQPTRGAFANRDGLGEDRAAPDAIDAGAISGMGELRFQRRYGMSPDRREDLECVRPG